MILPTQTAARKSIHETPFYIPPHKRAIYAANTDKEAEHFLTVKPAGPVALTIMSMGMVRLTISEIRKRPAVCSHRLRCINHGAEQMQEFLWDHLAEVLSFPCKSWQLFTGDVKVPPEMIFSLLDFSFSGIGAYLSHHRRSTLIGGRSSACGSRRHRCLDLHPSSPRKGAPMAALPTVLRRRPTFPHYIQGPRTMALQYGHTFPRIPRGTCLEEISGAAHSA